MASVEALTNGNMAVQAVGSRGPTKELVVHRQVVAHRPVFRDLAIDEPEGVDVLDIEVPACRFDTVETAESEGRLEGARPPGLRD